MRRAWLAGFVLAATTIGLIGAAGLAQAAPPISVYGALPLVEGVRLSPNGHRVAMFVNKDDGKFVFVRPVYGDGKTLYSAKLMDRNGAAIWADDDHIFVIGHRTEDTGTANVHEQTFIFLVDLRAGTSQQIAPTASTDDAPSTSGRTRTVQSISGIDSVIRKDGKSYAFFQDGSKFCRVDVATLQIVPVARFGEDQRDAVIDAGGQVLARVEYKDHQRKRRILPGATSETSLMSSEDDIAGVAALGPGRTPGVVLTALAENGSYSALRELDLKTGKLSEDLVQGVEAEPIQDAKSRLLIGFRLDGFQDDVFFIDPAVEQKWESVKAAFPGRKVSLASVDDDMKRWVVLTSGPTDSGHYYLIDLAQRKAVPLGAQYPDIKDADVGAMAWFDYKAGDGKDLKALVTLPPGYTRLTARNLPVVVLPHGGPQGRDYYGFNWWGQALASRGYVVIQPQFRGSGGYGQTFEREGWGQWGRLMQTDVSDALKAVAAEGIVDPNRACIVGWSYGGYTALAGVTLQQGLYRCAAAGAAPADLNAMLVWSRDRFGKLSTTMRYWQKSMALKNDGDPAGALISPARNAAQVTAPLMVIHGRQDTTVPIEQGEAMVRAMRAAGKPVEWVVLENETHFLESASTRTKMLEAMTGFLLRYNPPTAPSVAPTTTGTSR